MNRVLLFFGFCFGILSGLEGQVSNPVAERVKVAWVKSLDDTEAKKKLPVRLEGVVTRVMSWGAVFFQDDSAGIYVQTLNADQLKGVNPGTMLVVEGTTQEGQFAPIVVDARLQIIGETNIVPKKVFADHLVDSRLENQDVAVRGIVRSISKKGNALSMTTGLAQFEGTVEDYGPAEVPDQLLDAEVEIRGLSRALYNSRKQLLGAQVQAKSVKDVVVQKPAPTNPFSIPLRQINKLTVFSQSESQGHREKVEGTVTHAQSNEIYLSSGSNGALKDLLI